VFQKRDETFKGGADFYRTAFESDGRQQTVVVDIEPRDVFATGLSLPKCRTPATINQQTAGPIFAKLVAKRDFAKFARTARTEVEGMQGLP
jgi:hypothetical protein